jgi:recombination protein RecR
MNNLKKLEEIFAKFPGIGPKQARRFVYFLLTQSESSLTELSVLIKDLKQGITVCELCLKSFSKDFSTSKICQICRDESRDKKSLMLVARDMDLEHVEKLDVYNGRYFVMGGTVPILDKEPNRKIRINQLLNRLTTDKNISEIILAMNATPEGEHTMSFISETISPIALKNNLKISYLGRGLSTGTELEYSDKETLKNALERRI